jgi:RsiW-degrading membrane proteinase PrsW (M82 family)
VGVFVYALGRESFSFEMMASVLFGGFLFYAAPHLLWAVIVVIARLSNAIAHAGFIASTVALGIIACFWLYPGDPSGLPFQWMFYWPLALILLVVITGCTAVYIRIKAPDKALQPMPKSGAVEL